MAMTTRVTTNSIVLVSALAVIGVILHVIGLLHPLLGNFAQHQTDYATVVQRWLETGIAPANPVMRFMALGTNRLFYGDFPLNITLVALVCQLTGLSISVIGRTLSALCFFISLYPFYRLIMLTFKNESIALWSLFFYALSPLTLIYGQSFLLEMSALMWGMLGVYAFFKAYESKSEKDIDWILAGIFLSLMISTRIYYAPTVIPLGVMLLNCYRMELFRRRFFYVFVFFTLLLPVIWQIYAGQTAALRGDESSLSDNLRVFMFKDEVLEKEKSFLYFLPLWKSLIFKVVTPIGFGFALFGLFVSEYSENLRKYTLLSLISFLPLFLFASRKFVEFEYYFLPFVPLLSLAAAFAVTSLIQSSSFKKWGVGLVIIANLLLAMRFSLAPMLIVPEEDKHVLSGAHKAQEFIPKSSRVIASHGSSSSFLYYLNRDGWAFALPDFIPGIVRNHEDHEGTAVDRIERFRGQGAEFFLLSNKWNAAQNPQLFQYLSWNYEVLFEDEYLLVYDLRSLKKT